MSGAYIIMGVAYIIMGGAYVIIDWDQSVGTFCIDDL